MIRVVLTLFIFSITMLGSDSKVTTKDISNFTMSATVQEQIKREIIGDINASFIRFRQELEKNLDTKFKNSEHSFKLDVVALKSEVKLLKEQISLFKEMIVDTNYQRNVRDDKVRLLLDSVKEIEKRLNALEEKKEAPLENKTGEKI